MDEVSGSSSEISSNETSSSGEVSENSGRSSIETSYVDENDARAGALAEAYEDSDDVSIGSVTEDDISDDKMNELTGDLEKTDGLKTQEYVTDEDITDAKMSNLEKSLNNADKTDHPTTPQEVSVKQEESLKDGLNRLEKGDNLTKIEKGNLTEIMGHQYFESQNRQSIMLPEKITKTLDDKNHHGIDDVFKETKSDGKTYYTIVEAKFDTAKPNPHTLDGPQGSWPWIKGSSRLDKAVGKPEADKIREAYEDDGFSRISVVVYHYNPHPDGDGLTHSDIYPLNEKGEKSGPSIIVESFQGSERVESYDVPYEGRKSK